jgi:phosphoglycerate dehydrogenase-like enzyme
VTEAFRTLPASPMKVLLLNAYAAIHAERLRRLLTTPWDIATFREGDRRENLVAALADADAVVVTRYTADLPPAPRLKLIQSPAAGYDRMDAKAIPPGCVVCNVHEHAIGISEYVMLAMLEWQIGSRRIDANFRRGSWEDGLSVLGPTHGEVFGKTLGIVGLGHIGLAVARRAKAFGMRVTAATRTPRAHRHVDWVVGIDALDAWLPECDFILIACPLSAGTRGLLNAPRLALCRRSAVIINVARAEIIEEAPLYAALRDGLIGGAVLDVWYRYPTPDDRDVPPASHPFHELPNVVMTPHCAAWTSGLFERRWGFIAANLDRFSSGEQLRNIVIGPLAAPARMRG